MKLKKNNGIIGAIAGDVIGSVYEFKNSRTLDFELFTEKSTFTDDTVLTMAVLDCIKNDKDYTKTIHEYARKYQDRGYGGMFKKWIESDDPQPYNSYGNGSAMRVSPVGFLCKSFIDVYETAKKSAEVTHSHDEGIRGARAIALSIWLARYGLNKDAIKETISKGFLYNLDFKLDDIRESNKFDETCQVTVPQAIVAFLESTDYESAIRLAISIGGDSDTIACMTGGIAAAYYKEIPDYIAAETFKRLPEEFMNLLNQ